MIVFPLSHMLSHTYRWNSHMVAGGIHLQRIDIVVTAVVGVDVVEYPGAPNFVVWISSNEILLCYGIVNIMSSELSFHHAVLVTGLPPSASWQDLKVGICFDELVTAAGHNYSSGCMCMPVLRCILD